MYRIRPRNPSTLRRRNGFEMPTSCLAYHSRLSSCTLGGMRQRQATAPRESVLSRVIRPERDDLSAAAARSLLKLAFEPADLERMHELAVKNQQGELSREEEVELADYRQAGLLLDLLQAKARLSLKKRGLARE